MDKQELRKDIIYGETLVEADDVLLECENLLELIDEVGEISERLFDRVMNLGTIIALFTEDYYNEHIYDEHPRIVLMGKSVIEDIFRHNMETLPAKEALVDIVGYIKEFITFFEGHIRGFLD